MKCHYSIPVDGLHLDSNVHASKTFSPGLEHWFARGYVYHEAPQGSGTYHPVQRKQMWFGYNSGTTYWTCGLTTDSSSGTPSPATVRFFMNGSAACSVPADNATPQYSAGTIFWGAWVCLEVEVVLNTPGVEDGIVRVWINGTRVIEDITVNIRGTCNTGCGYISFGRQADRTAGNVVDENRYWDDIVVASYYIGT